MKFGVRQCANIVFRAKQETTIGNQVFHVGQPVLYIDTATTSSLEQAATTVYATGGRGNARLIAWEGEKTMTFTLTDALLSPIGFHVLSGCGLFKRGNGNQGNETGDQVHFHMTTMASIPANGEIDLTEALVEFGYTSTTSGDTTTWNGNAKICTSDAPIYIMEVEDDGSITGGLISGDKVEVISKAVNVGDMSVNIAGVIKVTNPSKTNTTVMVDYYVDLPGQQVYEMDVTQDTFGGFYYVEADTLFRRQKDGKDLPANLTFPNVKIQSNFTMTFAATGDPSTFDFTMDAFPGYTYFDKKKKVLCVFQVVDGTLGDTSSLGDPVMYHDDQANDYDGWDDHSII